MDYNAKIARIINLLSGRMRAGDIIFLINILRKLDATEGIIDKNE